MDQASEPGEIGRILRREGIYYSMLSKWRRQRAEGIELGLSEKARGVKGPSVKSLQEENRKLQRQKTRLEEELRRARRTVTRVYARATRTVLEQAVEKLAEPWGQVTEFERRVG